MEKQPYGDDCMADARKGNGRVQAAAVSVENVHAAQCGTFHPGLHCRVWPQRIIVIIFDLVEGIWKLIDEY